VILAFRQIEPASANEVASKPDLIFLHGTGSNSHMWDKQADYFSRLGYRSFLIDLRGHGESEEPYEKASLETYKTDVIDTLATTKANYPAYFIGHSLGSLIGVALAEEYPELFAGIFAASYPADVATPLLLALRAAVRGPLQLVQKTGVHKNFAWRERTLFEMDPHTLDQLAILFRDENWLNRDLKLRCPIHFSVGRFDPVALSFQVKEIQKRTPNSSLQIIDWGAHNFMDASPNEFNTWILSHLP
jgi:pimeloyl-ACP methyl ester carboxylesterase